MPESPPEPRPAMPRERDPRALRHLALLFLRLGATAFGGPAAHIAMMEDEVVPRRRWLTREEFLDLLGATNLIPGPNSTEMAIHIGHRQGGAAGLLVAGACFILPAALITLAMAWFYVRFGSLPQAEGILYGVKPVIIAVVVQALWGLSRSAVKSWLLAAAAGLSLGAAALGVNELAVLAGAGVSVVVARRIGGPHRGAGVTALVPGIPLLPAAATGAVAGVPFSLSSLFLFFLKVGAILYGSGYVLLAFLRTELVEQRRWLTEAQLLDAVAVGQVTPGPVFTTATFVGYVLGGPAGGGAATVGIFLPAFFFVALSGPLVPRLRRSPAAGAFLDGVNVASLALMALVTWQLSRAAVRDWPSAALVAGSALLLLRYKLNSAWLVLGGGLIGLALSFVGTPLNP